MDSMRYSKGNRQEHPYAQLLCQTVTSSHFCINIAMIGSARTYEARP